MLPYLAQRAASKTVDGATLGTVLEVVTSSTELASAIGICEVACANLVGRGLQEG